MSDLLRTGLWGIGTALPPHRMSQEELLAFMQRQHPERAVQRRLRSIYRRSCVEWRYSCCPDFAPDAAPAVAGLAAGQAGTAARLERYAGAVVPLACQAAGRALASQGRFGAADVTHLIWVTCTGFAAPGPDLALAAALGLGAGLHRQQIGFMGCQAALQGLRSADAICRSDPHAVVLLVCAELCSLHFQPAAAAESLVVNSLFGDGAAALLAAVVPPGPGPSPPVVRGFLSRLVPGTGEALSWHIGDHGFRMGLALDGPEQLRRPLPGFVADLLAGCGVGRPAVSLWAVHPGGRAVLDAVGRALCLTEADLAASRGVLRQCGNMSSATVLFVLERLWQERAAQAGTGVMLSFGPGLSLEGMVWRQEGDGR